jgi:hypothetical protein
VVHEREVFLLLHVLHRVLLQDVEQWGARRAQVIERDLELLRRDDEHPDRVTLALHVERIGLGAEVQPHGDRIRLEVVDVLERRVLDTALELALRDRLGGNDAAGEAVLAQLLLHVQAGHLAELVHGTFAA